MADRAGLAPPEPPADSARVPLRPRRSLGGLAFTTGLFLLGLALRIAVALRAASPFASREWEAEGFLQAWEALGWLPPGHVRPPLMGWLLHSLASAFELEAIASVRLLAVGLSVAPLIGALLLARAIVRSLPERRVLARGLATRWIVGCWALWPGLVLSAASPTGDALLGAALCCVAAAAVRLGARPSLPATLALSLAATAALLLGGLPVALSLCAGLLVYLLPVPPLRAALPPVLAVLLACAAAWYAQDGANAERRWVPEAAPAYALAALVERPIVVNGREPMLPELRTLWVYEQALEGLQEAGPWRTGRLFVQRLVGDLLNPARFDTLGERGWLAGLFDLFLRGGLLLFAVATLRFAGARGSSAFPRAGLVTGALVLLLALTASATHPFALVAFDALLLGAAGAGLAQADPGRRALRWQAFGVGGLLLAGLGVGPLIQQQRLSDWVTTQQLVADQGSRLVRALADAGPHELHDAYLVTEVLLDDDAPFLRSPAAARRHALDVLQQDPQSERALSNLVVAEVGNFEFERASELADTLRDDVGLTAKGRVLSIWVRDQARRWRSAGSR